MVLFVYTDLLKVKDCQHLFDVGFEKFGKIDGFFNYAGVTPVSPLDTCDEETFDWVTNVNYKAAIFLLSGSGEIYEDEWGR